MKNGIISTGKEKKTQKKTEEEEKKLNSFDLQAKLALPYLVFEKWRKFSSHRARIYIYLLK